MSLAEWSLRRPVTAIMFYVSLMVLGAIAAFRLPLEQFPAISAPFLYVELPYPGATPEEVERTLVRPVEEALAKALVRQPLPVTWEEPVEEDRGLKKGESEDREGVVAH